MSGGVPERAENDSGISADTELWRRIPLNHWVEDTKVPLGYRPSSDSFNEPNFSVVIAAECTGGIATLLRGHEEYGVASFTVQHIREIGFGIIRVPDAELPGHAHITGKASRGKRADLARKCTMLRIPDGA